MFIYIYGQCTIVYQLLLNYILKCIGMLLFFWSFDGLHSFLSRDVFSMVLVHANVKSNINIETWETKIHKNNNLMKISGWKIVFLVFYVQWPLVSYTFYYINFQLLFFFIYTHLTKQTKFIARNTQEYKFSV